MAFGLPPALCLSNLPVLPAGRALALAKKTSASGNPIMAVILSWLVVQVSLLVMLLSLSLGFVPMLCVPLWDFPDLFTCCDLCALPAAGALLWEAQHHCRGCHYLLSFGLCHCQPGLPGTGVGIGPQLQVSAVCSGMDCPPTCLSIYLPSVHPLTTLSIRRAETAQEAEGDNPLALALCY